VPVGSVLLPAAHAPALLAEAEVLQLPAELVPVGSVLLPAAHAPALLAEAEVLQLPAELVPVGSVLLPAAHAPALLAEAEVLQLPAELVPVGPGSPALRHVASMAAAAASSRRMPLKEQTFHISGSVIISSTIQPCKEIYRENGGRSSSAAHGSGAAAPLTPPAGPAQTRRV
jgi:hypothetical protein